MRPIDPRLVRDRRVGRTILGLAGVRAASAILATVASALLLAGAFDAVVSGGSDAAGLLRSGAALVSVVLADATVARAVRTRIDRLSTRERAALRQDLLQRVLDDGRSVAPGEVAVLATRGVDALQPYLADYLPRLVEAALVPAFLLAVVFVLDPPSGVILLVTLPLVPLFLALVGRFSQARAAGAWAGLERLSAHVLDVITGLATLKRFGRHRVQADTIARLSERARRATMAALRTAFLSAFVLELAATLAVALVAVPLGLRLVSGSVALGTAFAVLLLAPEVFAPLRRLGIAYHTATEGVAATERILDVVSPVAPCGTRAVPADVDLVVADVAVRRPARRGNTPDGAGFTAAPGDVVALIGPNGAGKSTLLDVARGVVTPDEGSVQVGGIPLDELDPNDWASTVAWVPQRPVLVDDDVRTNIALGAPRAAVGQVEAVATSLGLAAVLDDRARTLSAGQRQRVALARAVLRVEAGGGRIALLDEPTANLDGATEAVVVEVVRRLADHGAAVVVVAHRPALVAVADRVVAVAGDVGHAGGEREVAATATGIRDDLVGSSAAGLGPTGPDAAPATTSAMGPRRGDAGAAAEAATDRTAANGTTSIVAAASQRGAWSGPWSWGWRVTRPVRWRLLATVVTGAAAITAGVALTATAAWLLSRASQHPEVLSLTTVVVAVRALALGKAGLRYVERLVSHDTVLRMVDDLRVRTFDRLAVLTPAGLSRSRHGDLHARVVGDLDRVQDLWLRGLLPPLAVGLAGTSVVVGASLLLPAGGLLLAGAVIVGGVLVTRLTRRRPGLDVDVTAERVALTEEVVDLTEAAEELAAYGAARPVLRRIAEHDDRLVDDAARDAAADGRAGIALAAARGLTTAAMLAVAAASSRAGDLDPLAVPVVALLAWMLPELLGDLPGAARRRHDLAPAARRIDEVLTAADPFPDPLTPAAVPDGHVGVRLDDLAVRWPGERTPVIDGLTLDLAAGEVVALEGPSGAGKSTLAATLVGFVRPEAGTITIGGVDAGDLRGDDLRRLVGWCAQDSHLFDATLRDNLRVARPEATDEQLSRSLRAVRLEGWLASLPLGLDTRVGTRGSWLSGGQAQRLALAQVLLADPTIVILDEPTANLDPETATALLTDLLAATSGRTTLVITHRPEDAGAADRFVRLDHGQLSEVRGSRDSSDRAATTTTSVATAVS